MEIRDLTGLEFATNLETLVLRNNLVEDLSPLSSLARLKVGPHRKPNPESWSLDSPFWIKDETGSGGLATLD